MKEAALEDFINLLQVLLRYFRKILFAQYLIDKEKRAEITNIKEGKPLDIIENVKKKTAQDENTKKLLDSFEKSYKYEKEVYADRIRKTENLAAVGLSVETASHDVMIILKKSLTQIHQIIDDLHLDGEINKKNLLEQMVSLDGNMKLVYTQMKDIRLLFPSAKTKRKRCFDSRGIRESKSIIYETFSTKWHSSFTNCIEWRYGNKSYRSSIVTSVYKFI